MRRGSIFIVLALLPVLFGCAASSKRSATLESRHAELDGRLITLEKKVGELDGRLAALSKRLATVQATRPAGRLGAVEPEQPKEPVADRPRDSPTPTRAPAVAERSVAVPELDVDGLSRESSRQLPGGYERGLELLRQGAYEQAIQTLRDFVRAKHGSPFVAGAQYWIGQAHMQLGQFYQAILAFTEVQQRFPRDDYAPPAAYASGVAFLQLGNVSEARRGFERVLAEHPGTPQAAKAEARLRELGGAAR